MTLTLTAFARSQKHSHISPNTRYEIQTHTHTHFVLWNEWTSEPTSTISIYYASNRMKSLMHTYTYPHIHTWIPFDCQCHSFIFIDDQRIHCIHRGSALMHNAVIFLCFTVFNVWRDYYFISFYFTSKAMFEYVCGLEK